MKEWIRKSWKILILIGLVFFATALYFGDFQLKKHENFSFIEPGKNGRPMILDLGSTGCVPCQMMVPVLKDLTSEYQGEIDIQFIDIGERHQLAERFQVFAIPTQIFFDREGKEVFRHGGFFPKTEIDKKLKQLGLH